MRKTFALLITLALAASCVEQEVLAPVEPSMPGSDVLIVPGLSIGASVSGEAASGHSSAAAMTGGSGTTRAATYPYVIANAAGKKSVIVTKDADGEMENMTFHERWEQTPAHEQRATNPRTDVSLRFEVAQEDASSSAEIWSNENDRCKAPWRRPTQDELVLIRKWDAQLEITHLQNIVYWSSTKERGYQNRIGVRENSTVAGWGPNDGRYKWLTRCVRDLYDNFPDATGSNVATLWGYTSTNALGSENLIPPTVIKNTATGFELAILRYYPANGNKLYFYAHAPHAGGVITDGNGATVQYNNLDGQQDVMWAKDVRGIAKSSGSTQTQTQPFFQFQHKLMQLKFKIVADASFEANKTVTNITVKNVSTSVRMTIKDGATTFSGSGNISINPTIGNAITTGGTTLAEAMMIAPGSAVTLGITAGGVTFPDITLTGLSAQAGTSHLITLTFKRNTIVPTASAADWTTGGSADVGVI